VTKKKFDLLIVGTGSGNSILTPDFDDWSVAIVEKDVFGGTCLNRGCIPTKMFVYVADLVEGIRHGSALGVDADVRNVRWRDVRDRIFGRIDPIAAGGEDYRTNRCPNVTVFRGAARFVAPHRVSVNGEVIEAKHVVIAAGARPMVPAVPGLAESGFHTSDTIMRLDEVPRRLAILGGGFIACEMAHVFEAFGSKVTLINRSPELLRSEDHDIRQRFLESARGRFDVRASEDLLAVRRNASGLTLLLEHSEDVEADALLVATGRVPNTDELDLAAAGYALEADGRLVVDAHQQTSVHNTYALGDISSSFQLKHVANHEARVVAHNLAHPHRRIESDHRFVPHAVFGSPQIAAVGLTEEDARSAGLDVIVASRPYGDTAYGWAMEDRVGLCKLVADRVTRRLLGAHVIGANASMLLQQLIQGMAFGQTIDEMARGQYYIHPALSEVVENALLGFPPA
jgi:mycothione reductase